MQSLPDPPESMHALTLELHPVGLAVVRLPADAAIPAWARGKFVSITRTPHELSVVCDASDVPTDAWDSDPWNRIEVAGPLALTETGILSNIAAYLADAEIPIFTIATYDTDHILVRQRHADGAAAALRSAGHTVN